MMASEYSKSGRVTSRLNNTSQGNARFMVTFSDGTQFKTARDSQVNYKIENSEYDGDVVVTVENGEITHIRPARADA